MGISWGSIAWWNKPDVVHTYIGPAPCYATTSGSGGGGDIGNGCSWTISTTTYEPPEYRVFYHPSRAGPTWKNTSQRVTRKQLSRYTKA